MRQDRTGRWLLVLAASFAAFSVIFGFAAWLIFRDRPGWTSSDVMTAIGIAAGFGGVVGALFGQPLFGQWLTEVRAVPASGTSEALEDADRLAEAVKDQWTRAATERRLSAPSPIPVEFRSASLPVAGPLSAAVGSQDAAPRFEPLPGLAGTTEVELRSGRRRELHAIYGGLDSGRLLIIGEPGSGKTGAAVLLVIDALTYRERVPDEDRARVPVPVLLTVQGWDPGSERFESWLLSRLAETYPMFTGKKGAARARALLSRKSLAVILDGLDEIPSTLRPAALRALSDQAVFRVVILTRSAEMVAAASEAHFVDAAAIELQDVDARVAADYLTRLHIDPVPEGWQALIDRLNDDPASTIAQALSTPLTLTLLRDTYRPDDDLSPLFQLAGDAPDVESAHAAIEDHLLDRMLPAAYAPRPGDGTARYDLETARRALTFIATRMNQDHTRDLRWWELTRWSRLAPRLLVSGLAGALLLGVPSGLVGGTRFGLASAACGMLAGVANGFGGSSPSQAVLDVRQLFRADVLVGGIAGALGAGVLGAAFAVATDTKPVQAAVLVCGLLGGIMVLIQQALSEPVAETTSPLTPLACWRADRRYGVVIGLVIAAGSVGLGLALGAASVALVGGAAALLVGASAHATWPSALAFLQLAGRRHTPPRLIRFLEDARARGLLRTVGPVYQFRHARLQDRLSEEAPIQDGDTLSVGAPGR